MKPMEKAKLSALEQKIKYHREELEKLEFKHTSAISKEIYAKLEEVIGLARIAGNDTLMYALEDVSIEHFGGGEYGYDPSDDWDEGSWG